MTRLVLAALVVLALGGVTASGADFTATSSSTSSFGAAADFNTVAVSLTNPGTPLANTVGLSATASSNRGVNSVVFQAAPANTTDWVTLCTDNVAPYTCAWNTTTIADDSYDVRATATDTAGYARTSTVAARVVNNYILSVALSDPGPMSGNESLTATASNAEGGGLQSLKIQHRAPGAGSWTDVCFGSTTSPRICGLDTTVLANGPRELRAVATDLAGHTAQSAMITRTVDNTPPTVTPSVPSSGTGNVSMNADAQDDGSGINYVAFEAYYQGQWYEFCRDTSAPYTCSGDSAAVPDGTYSIRVIVENGAGVRTTSSSSTIIIDNPPYGTDVQTGNALTAGLMESGDWIRLTWSEPIAAASVLAGWTGSSQAIRVRVTDAGTNDQIDFLDGSGATRLNLVSTAADLKLGGNYVSANTDFNATMIQSATAITVTLGSVISGTVTVVGAPTTMTWLPSAGAKDATNHASRTTQVTEPGTADVDF